MKFPSAAVVLFAAINFPSQSTAFHTPSKPYSPFGTRSRPLIVRSATTEEAAGVSLEEKGSFNAKDEPTKSMTERMMAKAPVEGQ